MTNIHEVALWKRWDKHTLSQVEDLPLIADMEAEDPYKALFDFMAHLHLLKVAHAAVRCPDGLVLRWDDVDRPVEVEL